MRIDQTIKVLRMESGLSQSELSEKLNIASATVARCDLGESYPKKKMAEDKEHRQENMEYMMGRKTPYPDCPLPRIVGYEFGEQTLLHRDGKSYLRIRGRKSNSFFKIKACTLYYERMMNANGKT